MYMTHLVGQNLWINQAGREVRGVIKKSDKGTFNTWQTPHSLQVVALIAVGSYEELRT